jgi:hypothetical protein
MAMAEVIELAAAVVDRLPGKCPDCFGTGGVLDEDGSSTGIVGHPVACGCMSYLGCKVLAHPAGCDCYEREIEQWRGSCIGCLGTGWAQEWDGPCDCAAGVARYPDGDVGVGLASNGPAPAGRHAR